MPKLHKDHMLKLVQTTLQAHYSKTTWRMRDRYIVAQVTGWTLYIFERSEEGPGWTVHLHRNTVRIDSFTVGNAVLGVAAAFRIIREDAKQALESTELTYETGR